MSFTIAIQPGGQQYQANADQTLLEAALNAGLLLPYGCRDGACGACKGKVLQGSIDQGRYQPHALSAEEIAEGKTLFCVAKPQSDLTIECRQVSSANDIPVRKLPTRVESLEKVADDVMIIKLRLPASEKLQFRAGQYLDFLLADGQRRSFSIANAPQNDNLLELHVRLVPGGQFTTHVFEGMKVRDILRIEAPLGTFWLRDSGKPIVLLAGGTGFAPIKGIVEQLLARHAAGEAVPAVHLYWGARNQAGLYQHELAQHWTSQFPGFQYIPVLSDEPWDGRTGLVHHAILADFSDLSGHEVYACGAPAMIEAAKADLMAQCQLAEDSFFADAFTFASHD